MNSGKAMDNGSPPFLLYNFFNINHYGNLFKADILQIQNVHIKEIIIT